MAAGRKTAYNNALAATVCGRIAAGESLRTICADAAMPSMATVQRWLAAHPEFASQYSMAREDQADVLAEEMLDVARAKSADQVEATDKRLLIDALKWRAGKLRPKVYGDSQRIDQNVTGDVQHTVRVVLSDE